MSSFFVYLGLILPMQFNENGAFFVAGTHEGQLHSDCKYCGNLHSGRIELRFDIALIHEKAICKAMLNRHAFMQ